MAAVAIGLAAAGATSAGLAAASVAASTAATYVSLAYVVASTAATMLLTKRQVTEGSRLEDRKITTSSAGNTIPIIYGTTRIAGDVIFASEIREVKHSQKMGKSMGGGATNNTYSYYADVGILLCRNKIKAVSKIFKDSKLVLDLSDKNTGQTKNFTGSYIVYTGEDDQMPDPTYEAIRGVGKTPAFRGMSYIVFKNLELTSNSIPNFNFEIVNTEEDIESYNFEIETTELETTLNTSVSSSTLSYNKINNCVYSSSTGNGMFKYNINQKRIDKYKNYYDNNFTLRFLNRESSPFYNNIINFTENGDPVCVINQSGNKIALFDKDTLELKKSLISTDFDNLTGFNYNFIANNNIMFSVEDMRYYSICADNSQNFLQILMYDADFDGIYRRDIPFSNNNNDLSSSYRPTKTISTESNIYAFNKQKNEAYYCNYRRSYDATRNLNRYLSISKVRFSSFSLDENYAILINDQLDFNHSFVVSNMILDENNEFLYITLNYQYANRDQVGGHQIIKYDVNNNKVIWDMKFSNKVLATTGYFTTCQLVEDKLLISFTTNENKPTFLYIDVDNQNKEFKTYDTNAPVGIANVFNAVGYINNENIFLGYMNAQNKNVGTASIRKLYTERYSKGSYRLKSLIQDLLKRSGLDVGKEVEIIGLDDDEVHGFMCANTSASRSYLEQLAQVYNFDIVSTDFKLKFVKANQEPILTINSKDIGVITYSSNPKFQNDISTKRTPDLELPKVLNINYIDIDIDYQQNTQDAYRQMTYAEEIKNLDVPICMYADEAKKAAEQLLYNTWTQRDTYNFETNFDYIFLEPTDVIKLYDENNDMEYTVKLIKKEEDVGIIKWTAVSYDALVFDQFGKGASSTNGGQTIKRVSATDTYFIDMPIVRIDDDNFGFYVAAAPQDPDSIWDGSVLYKAQNGNTSYNDIQSFNNDATVGSTVSKLGDFTNYTMVDNFNYVDVYIKNGELESVSENEFLSNENIAIVGNEYISFQNAELIGKNTYRLTKLLRGRWNTKDEIGNHNFGDRFILVDYKTFRRQSSEYSDNNSNFYKNVTYTKTIGDTNFTVFKNNDVGLMAYPVFNIEIQKAGNNEINIYWSKSVRGNNNLIDGIDLSDPDGDNYEIEIYNKNNVLLTTLTSTTLSCKILAADVNSLGISSGFTTKIYKLNKYKTRGKVSTYTITF